MAHSIFLPLSVYIILYTHRKTILRVGKNKNRWKKKKKNQLHKTYGKIKINILDHILSQFVYKIVGIISIIYLISTRSNRESRDFVKILFVTARWLYKKRIWYRERRICKFFWNLWNACAQGVPGHYRKNFNRLRRFVHNYANIIHPFTNLLRKGVKWRWSNKMPII